MTDLERQILDALTELDSAVKSMASAHPKPNLIPLFDRIEVLGRGLPRGTDPDLLHYLQRKSYDKARLLLSGRASENARGTCSRDGSH